MKDLIKKLRHNTLSPAELTQLREWINSAPDEEVLQYISPDEEAIPDDGAYSGSIARIKEHIDSRIAAVSPRRRLPVWLAAAAAAVVASVVVAGAFLYMDGRGSGSAPLAMNTITTGSGAGDSYLTLSDGTEVRLRKNSTLGYPSGFSGTARTVSFEGEAFFDVAHREGEEFRIEAPGMVISVKGTSFGVSARPDMDYSRVTLFEGVVDLTSTRSNEHITLTSGNIATLNTGSGRFSVSSMNPDIQIDWKSDEIHCHNIPPDSLIANFERFYNVSLAPGIKKAINSNFTGTLPFDNLNEAIKVLGRIYGFGNLNMQYPPAAPEEK